jgi:hypothetical protein
MDPAAELTLRLIRAGQEALDPKSSLLGWTVFPEIRHLSWVETRNLLAEAPKPLLVAALIEPGVLAYWKAAELDAPSHQSLDDQISNQCAYFDSKLELPGLALVDEVETPDQTFRLSVADFRRWVREYCISTVGIGMSTSPRQRTARLHVRRPGGHQPPIGWEDPST